MEAQWCFCKSGPKNLSSFRIIVRTQQAITYWKLTIETLEQAVKYAHWERVKILESILANSSKKNEEILVK